MLCCQHGCDRLNMRLNTPQMRAPVHEALVEVSKKSCTMAHIFRVPLEHCLIMLAAIAQETGRAIRAPARGINSTRLYQLRRDRRRLDITMNKMHDG